MTELAGSARGVAVALAVALASVLGSPAFAQDVELLSLSASRIADLEQAFWVCDYTATTEGIAATPIALCAAVTDALKSTKFDGDSDAFVAWWRENKSAEFRKLQSARER